MYEAPYYDMGGGGLMQNRRGPHSPPKAKISAEGKQAILTAAKDELRRLLDAEKFDVRELSSIARLAEQTRMLLADLAVDIKEAAKMAQEAGELDGMVDGTGAFGGALSPGGFNENFGGGVMREIIPALKKIGEPKAKRDSIKDMVGAAAEARKEGLNELADDIIERVRDRMIAEKPEMSDEKPKEATP